MRSPIFDSAGLVPLFLSNLATASMVALFILLSLPAEPECLEIHMELEPAPMPAPPAPKPKEQQAFMHAGELVAFWKAWESCKGAHCID